MSRKGSILRGEKWYLMNREADGTLKKCIAEDKDKMIDVNAYLQARDPVVKKENKEITKSKGKK